MLPFGLNDGNEKVDNIPPTPCQAWHGKSARKCDQAFTFLTNLLLFSLLFSGTANKSIIKFD